MLSTEYHKQWRLGGTPKIDAYYEVAILYCHWTQIEKVIKEFRLIREVEKKIGLIMR